MTASVSPPGDPSGMLDGDGRGPADGPRIELAPGPRAVEGLLLDVIAADLAAVRAEPRLLARPLRIVVNSGSLRDHVGAAVARRLGHAVAGVALDTLHTMSLEILERCEEPPPSGERLYPVLVRQNARSEPALRGSLEGLADGYGVVEAAISDLLDAGFAAPLAEVVEERLDECESEGLPVDLARAVFNVAVQTLAALEKLGLGHRSQLVARATELLERDPERALPARGVVVHGFSDATGVVSRLIEALLRHRDAVVLLDAPPDPGGPRSPVSGPPRGEATEIGGEFTRRFREALQGVADTRRAPSGALPVETLEVVVAPGPECEIRGVAERVRGLLDRGVVPETVAVVARNPAPFALSLRTHFGRLSVPFSGVAAQGPGGAAVRRMEALRVLLRDGERAPCDRWLDCLVATPAQGSEANASQPRGLSRGEREDLRLGLRHSGAARLADAASLRVGERDLALPVRGGLSARATEGEAEAVDDDFEREARSFAAHRRLPAKLLRGAVAAAAGARARLAGWPDRAELGEHVAMLQSLVERDLGWDAESGTELAGVKAALASVDRDLPARFEIERNDFWLLVGRALGEVPREPVGGRGGGVQILSVTEARARTFEHLFVIGLDRDVFPRSVREDPLLPDVLRRPLRDVLPDIPVKRVGADEERFLFAQLCAASPQVYLSWHRAAEDGRACAESSFLVRLRGARPDLAPQQLPPLDAPPAPNEDAPPRPAREHALLVGLHGGDDAHEAALALAVCERDRMLSRLLPEGLAEPARDAGRMLARARRAVVREMDAAPSERLGPYFGFAGPAEGDADPRNSALFVTSLERMARCPWQFFVEKMLRIEPVPDPIEALPEVDARLLGSVIHRVLDRIVAESPGASSMTREIAFDAGGGPAAEPPASPVPWPGDAAILETLRETAETMLAEEGCSHRGLLEVVVKRALPYLDRARDLDWAERGPRCVGAEVQGKVTLAHAGGLELGFRADRVDATEEGLWLTDYKAGRLPAHKRPKTRHDHLLADVLTGVKLQAFTYALALGTRAGGGRYLYLEPHPDPRSREWADLRVSADEAEFRAAFDDAVGRLAAGRAAGSFPPRLLDARGREPSACARCTVAEACLRGDSGARGRLSAWLEAARQKPDLGALEANVVSLFDLADKDRRDVPSAEAADGGGA